MKSVSLLYNNSLLTLDNLIDSILCKNENCTQVYIPKILEESLFYSITLNNFYATKHNFEIYYKNNFLIIRVIEKITFQTLITRIFYLNDINIYDISHVYYNNVAKLKVPKLI